MKYWGWRSTFSQSPSPLPLWVPARPFLHPQSSPPHSQPLAVFLSLAAFLSHSSQFSVEKLFLGAAFLTAKVQGDIFSRPAWVPATLSQNMTLLVTQLVCGLLYWTWALLITSCHDLAQLLTLNVNTMKVISGGYSAWTRETCRTERAHVSSLFKLVKSFHGCKQRTESKWWMDIQRQSSSCIQNVVIIRNYPKYIVGYERRLSSLALLNILSIFQCLAVAGSGCASFSSYGACFGGFLLLWSSGSSTRAQELQAHGLSAPW